MSAIALRRAGRSDIPAFTRIYADAVLNGTASYEIEPPDEIEMTGRFLAVTGAGYPWITAAKGQNVVGYAYGGPFRRRPAYRFIAEDSVYVDRSARGQGVGRLLLERLVGEIEKLGFRQLIAVIGDGANHRASLRLHERAGFVHSGTIAGSGYKFGRWLDTVIMQLALNGGASTSPDPDSFPERAYRAQRGK